MKLSEIGEFAKIYWTEIVEHFSFVKLHEWIVMPNHIHGIIEIDKTTEITVETPVNGVSRTERDAMNRVSTMVGGITKNKNPMLHKNISTIIRWFKGRASFEIRKINPDFAWQSRFYEHIIRNEKEFEKISEYIKYNPQKWEDDCYFKNVETSIYAVPKKDKNVETSIYGVSKTSKLKE